MLDQRKSKSTLIIAESTQLASPATAKENDLETLGMKTDNELKETGTLELSRRVTFEAAGDAKEEKSLGQ